MLTLKLGTHYSDFKWPQILKKCRCESCDDEYQHSCVYFLFNTSNHISTALETGPSLISLLIFSSSPPHSLSTFPCSTPYGFFTSMLTCCLAWDFCTDLILLQHVRYVLRFNLYFIGTCTPAVNLLFHLQYMNLWDVCLIFFHRFLCNVTVLLFTNNSSCTRSHCTIFSAHVGCALSLVFTRFNLHCLFSDMKVNGLHVLKCS